MHIYSFAGTSKKTIANPGLFPQQFYFAVNIDKVNCFALYLFINNTSTANQRGKNSWSAITDLLKNCFLSHNNIPLTHKKRTNTFYIYVSVKKKTTVLLTQLKFRNNKIMTLHLCIYICYFFYGRNCSNIELKLCKTNFKKIIIFSFPDFTIRIIFMHCAIQFKFNSY